MKGKKNKGRRMGDGAGRWRLTHYATYQSYRLINDILRLPQQTNLFHL